MGLLDALKQYVSDSMPGGLLNPEWNKTNGQRLAEELNRGLLESTGINARDKRRAWERNKLDAVSGSNDTKASLNQQAYDSAMAMAGMAPMGLTVWHGSPHKFSKFDMSKIGTGEGAQAYGHGLYMAESPEVARYYLKSNGPGEDLTVSLGGKDVVWGNDLSQQQLDAIQLLEGGKRQAGQFPHNAAYYAKKMTDDPALHKLIDEWKDAKIGYKSHSSMYKVDIPDEAVARMLDWDKPLSQQAPEVQKMLEPLGYSSKADVAAHDDALMAALLGDGPTALPKIKDPMGSDIARGGGLFDGPDQVRKAKMLRDLGITGIRYLDGGSRAGGQGTSNYVLFSDQLPRILEVNGKPTGQTPWAAGEWNGLLGQ